MMDESKKKSRMFSQVIAGLALLMSIHSADATSITCNEVIITGRYGFDWRSAWIIGEKACMFSFLCPKECLCSLDNNYMNVTCPTQSYTRHVDYIAGNDSASHIKIFILQNADIYKFEPGAFGKFMNIENLQLILSGNMIAKIGSRQLEGLHNLYGLDLEKNIIDYIHPEAFRGLGNLRRLLLSHNRISDIHPGQFEDLFNLNWLFIENNTIVDLGEDQFTGLLSLKCLYTGQFQITVSVRIVCMKRKSGRIWFLIMPYQSL